MAQRTDPAMDDLYDALDLTNEQQELLDEVDAACKEIRQSEEETWLDDEFNRDRIDVFADAGLLGLPINEQYGGRGVDAVTNALALMRIGMEGAALRTFFSVHVNIGQFTIHLWGDEDQKEQYLPKTTSGDMLAGFALTEPDHGSDPSGMETTFEKHGDTYTLSGEKTWIGNGSEGDVFSLFAKDADTGKISAFIVERDWAGFDAEPIEEKMGYRNSNHGTITLDNVEVPAANRMGPEGKGLTAAYNTLLNGRLSVAAGSVGVIHDCLQEAKAYAQEREQWGEEIGKKQLVQRHLGQMVVKRGTARDSVLRAANAADAFFTDRDSRKKRDRAEKLTSIAKFHATESAFDMADRAVQVFGSKGYTFENRVARHFVDERATRIYEGTSDIHLLKLASMELGNEYKAF